MRTVLHLVRPGAEPAEVTERDWVVYLQPARLVATSAAPPCPPGPLDHDQLVALIFAADLVITW